MDPWTIAEYATGLFLILCMGGLILSPILHQKKKEQDKAPTMPSKPFHVAFPVTIKDSTDTVRSGCFLQGLRFTGDETDIFVGAWLTDDLGPDHVDTWCAVADQQGLLTPCTPDDLERVQREMERVHTMLSARPAALDLLMRDLWAQKTRGDRLSHSRSPLRKQETKALAEALGRTLTRLGGELSSASCQILLLPRLLAPIYQMDAPLRCESFDQLTSIPLHFSIEEAEKELLKATAGKAPADPTPSVPAESPETREEATHETVGH